MSDIAKELRQHMHRQHINAPELARKSGVKTSFIYDILNGKSTNPSTLKLAKVAHVLGLNLSQLVEPSSTSSPSLRITSTMPYDTTVAPQWLGASEQTPASKAISPLHFSKRWMAEQFAPHIKEPALFQIEGDSMSPTLQKGDLVLVNRQQNLPSPAGVYMIHDGVNHCPRRLEYIVEAGENMVHVSCDNDYYTSQKRRLDEITIIGRIVWFSRSLH